MCGRGYVLSEGWDQQTRDGLILGQKLKGSGGLWARPGQGGLTFRLQAEECGKRIWERPGSWWGLGREGGR